MERINIISFLMYKEGHPLLIEKSIKLLKGELSLNDLFESPPIRYFIKTIEDQIKMNEVDINKDELINFYLKNI